MKRLCLVFLLSFAVFWSVGFKSQKRGSYAKVEIIDGVECIHNIETPLYPDKTVTFVEELSIDGEGKDGNIILFKPRLSLVDDSQNIYIIDRQDQVIKVFDSEGDFIRTIGSKGRGPGEFQLIINLAITKDGNLLVTDQTARRTSFFDSSGQFIKSFQWLSRYSYCYLIKNSSYLTGEIYTSDDRQFWSLYVVELNFDGSVKREYGKFTMPQPKITRQGNRNSLIFVPDSPESIFTGDQDRDLFYHCLNNKYIIEVYNTSGKLFRKIDRPYEPVPFTKKDAEEYRLRYENIPDELGRKAVKNMKMPKVKSIVERMHVDDEGSLWVRTNEKKVEKNKILTAYDIFNSEGFYYARVWAPVLPVLFKAGKMYSMDIDSGLGYRSIKRYKMVWQ